MTRQTYQRPAVSEVYAVCFSIYGTLGEPHLALSMSSLMLLSCTPIFVHRIPAGAGTATGVRLSRGKCVYLFLGLGKVGEIPLFLG